MSPSYNKTIAEPIERICTELMSEQTDIEAAVREASKLEHLQPVDAQMAAKITNEHARKVLQLVRAFNNIPNNSYKVVSSDYRDNFGPKPAYKPTIHATSQVIFEKGNQYTAGVVLGHLEGDDSKWVIEVGTPTEQDSKQQVVDKDKVQLLDQVGMTQFPTGGFFAVAAGNIRKVVEIDAENGLARLDDMSTMPLSQVKQIYHGGEPLQSIPYRGDVHKAFAKIASRQTTTGYWDAAGLPVAGDVVQIGGTRHTIIDPEMVKSKEKVLADRIAHTTNQKMRGSTMVVLLN